MSIASFAKVLKPMPLALAVSIAMLSGTVIAADVTVYGVVDSGLYYTKASGSDATLEMASGITKGSRVGLRGKELLGNGYSVIFNLESGFTVDDGALDNTNNRLFNRGASLGVAAPWGKVEMGRLGALGSGVTGSIFLNSYTTFGNLYKEAQALQVIGHQVMRLDNAIRVESTSMRGFKLYGEYSNGTDGEDSGFDSKHDRFAAVGATYTNGPVSFVFVADNMFYAHSTKTPYYDRDDSQTYNFGAKYRPSKDWTFTVAYQIGRSVEKLGNKVTKAGNSAKDSKSYHVDPSGIDSNAVVLGMRTRVLGGELKLQGGYASGKSDVSRTSISKKKTYLYQDQKDHIWQLAVGYDYPLSKSTYLYGAAAYVNRNQKLSTYSTSGKNAGSLDKYTDTTTHVRSVMLGICHSF